MLKQVVYVVNTVFKGLLFSGCVAIGIFVKRGPKQGCPRHFNLRLSTESF
jgi:hypothetical protein